MAFPRLGDAGVQGIIEFVGANDRVKQKSEKPAFDNAPEPKAEKPEPVEEAPVEETAAEEVAAESTEAATEE